MAMSKDAPAPPDFSGWQAQYLRLISFPAEPQFSVQQDWWRTLTGEDRERRVEKSREVQEEGEFEGAILSLAIDLLKLQWTFAPVISAESIPEGIPVLGPLMKRKDWFRGHMHRWLEISPPITRLAFAAGLFYPVESREAGYQMLNQYLRCVDVDPHSTDFLYRVNRRTASRTGVAGLNVNRLTTWSVGKFEIAIRAQTAGLSGQEEASTQTMSEEKYACALQLDINTVPQAGRNLPAESLQQIFDELIEFGVGIATHGDR